MSIHPNECRAAADRGLSFLEARQAASGEFKTEVILHEAVDPVTGEAKVLLDESPFSASYIVHCLGFSEQPAARRMIAKAVKYFEAQRLYGGLWRYWNKGTALLGDIPADVDDTACISDLLERFGDGAPDNKRFLLRNRNSRDLFYTWIIPRAVPTLDLGYWRIILSDVTPTRSILFWFRSPAKRNDVDAIVNANAAFYFGAVPEVSAVPKFLMEVVEAGRENDCDKWYPDTNTFYYALSRCYARGFTQLARAREPMLRRMAEQRREDGCIGDNDMLTSLGVAAMLNFGESGDMIDSAARYLLSAQQPDGGWSRQPFYTNGSRPAQTSWASRELTTGFCIEVLERVLLNYGDAA